MKSPIDVIKGTVVGYDERAREIIIRAPYDDWFTLTKRNYSKCNVQLIDSRPLSDKQRRTCYKLIIVSVPFYFFINNLSTRNL